MMQMVSASKSLQSQKKLSKSRLYVSKLQEIISYFLSISDEKLRKRFLGVGRDSFLIFIIASDRGLCGSFNSSILKFSYEYIDKLISSGKKVGIVFFGRKAYDLGKFRYNVENILKGESSNGVTLNYIEHLMANIDLQMYDRVKVFYNKFYNTMVQEPTLELIRPLPYCNNNLLCNNKYEYEPANIKFILRSLMKNYISGSLYAALLENMASENSARMIAMESANKNTKEMLSELSLIYNRSRQSAVTTDLIEIIGGAEAL